MHTAHYRCCNKTLALNRDDAAEFGQPLGPFYAINLARSNGTLRIHASADIGGTAEAEGSKGNNEFPVSGNLRGDCGPVGK